MSGHRPELAWDALFTRDVRDSDFEAADSYLTLRWGADQAGGHLLRHAAERDGVTIVRANDVCRASGGVPWSWDDPGVRRSLIKALSGGRLHPPMLVTTPGHEELVIADGSHRVALAYHIDPFFYFPAVLA